MLLRSFLVSLFLLPTSLAAADSDASRCTGPTKGTVRVILDTSDGNACVGFVAAGKEHHFSRMIRSSVGLQVSKAVAFVDGEKIANPRVLQIWHGGKRVRQYDVNRLVKDTTKVEESISHVRWVAQLPTSIEATFKLITTSGREITFDSKTGEILTELQVPVPKRP